MLKGLGYRLLHDTRGGVATVAAFVLPAMLGGVGMAVDIGHWYQVSRTIQNEADSAAYAGALDLARQGLDGTALTSSITDAAQDALDRNGSTATLTLNVPPTTGLFAGDTRAVEAITAEPASLFFASLFMNSPPTVRGRAVAVAIVSDACVWSLNPSQAGALTVSGSAPVDLSCGVYVNSDDPNAALNQTGSSCLNATSMSVVGGASGACLNPAPETMTAPLPDPLASVPEPTYSGCDHTSLVEVGGNATGVVLSPGVYCGGIDIKGEVTFEPGEYILNGGDLNIEGKGVVSNGHNGYGGVTFFLTGSGTNYANVNIKGGAEVDLTPRTTGDRANILFMQDRSAPSGTNYLEGGATMNLEGLLYFPNQHLRFAGGSATNPSDILLVSDTVEFTGNSYFNSNTAKSLLEDEYYARLVE